MNGIAYALHMKRLALLALWAAACGGLAPMVSHRELVARYQGSFYRQGQTLHLKVKQPGGTNLAGVNTRREGDTLVLAAGVWSGGSPRDADFTIQIDATVKHIEWLNPDGTRASLDSAH